MKLVLEIDCDKVVLYPRESHWPTDAQRLGTQLYHIVSHAARELHSNELAVGDAWPILDDEKKEVGECRVVVAPEE